MWQGLRSARAILAMAVAVAVAGCTGEGAQDPTAVASDTRSPAPVDAGSGLPEGASAVLPEPLHASVDDLPAGTVVVDPGAGADELLVGVRIAAGRSQRSQGLMQVPTVPSGTGMWFAFDDDRTGGFWMKGTLTDLDIAWVDAAGAIVATDTMPVCPGDPCPSYKPEAEYRSALEVPAGWLAANDVEVGDTAWLVTADP